MVLNRGCNSCSTVIRWTWLRRWGFEVWLVNSLLDWQTSWIIHFLSKSRTWSPEAESVDCFRADLKLISCSLFKVCLWVEGIVDLTRHGPKITFSFLHFWSATDNWPKSILIMKLEGEGFKLVPNCSRPTILSKWDKQEFCFSRKIPRIHQLFIWPTQSHASTFLYLSNYVPSSYVCVG